MGGPAADADEGVRLRGTRVAKGRTFAATFRALSARDLALYTKVIGLYLALFLFVIFHRCREANRFFLIQLICGPP
jgi:hypothetical protein